MFIKLLSIHPKLGTVREIADLLLINYENAKTIIRRNRGVIEKMRLQRILVDITQDICKLEDNTSCNEVQSQASDPTGKEYLYMQAEGSRILKEKMLMPLPQVLPMSCNRTLYPATPVITSNQFSLERAQVQSLEDCEKNSLGLNTFTAPTRGLSAAQSSNNWTSHKDTDMLNCFVFTAEDERSDLKTCLFGAH